LRKILVFSDLDGSLLDHDTYGMDEARKTAQDLRKSGAALILTSSKTGAEIEGYVTNLGLADPFIAEGGGVLFCPAGLFPDAPDGSREEGGYSVQTLGPPVEALREAFLEMRRALALPLRAYFEMDDAELQRLTSLPAGRIPRMRDRRASVPFIRTGGTAAEDLAPVREWAGSKGLRYARGGRFHHLTGSFDKGTAAARLADMYRRKTGGVLTIGIGDGPNDLPLLRWADRAVAIPAKEGLRPELAAVPGVRVAPVPGPAGWKAGVEDLFRELNLEPLLSGS